MDGIWGALVAAFITKEIAKEVYTDALQPGLTQLGRALGETIEITTSKLLLSYRLKYEKAKLLFEKNLDKFRKQLHSIPVEQIVSIPSEISVPVLDRLTYVVDEDISDAFVALLVSASKDSTANDVHPSFIYLIDRITPDEAKILKYMRENEISGIPFIYLKIYNKKDKLSYLSLDKILTGLENKVLGTTAENYPMYMENLISLGIIENLHGEYINSPEVYEKLASTYIPKHNSTPNGYNSPEVEKGLLKVTNFGAKFIEVCMKKVAI